MIKEVVVAVADPFKTSGPRCMAPNMVRKNAGFMKLFMEAIAHPLVPFHCIIQQEVLCAKAGFTELNDLMSVVTKIVNLIGVRPLHKREFSALLHVK